VGDSFRDLVHAFRRLRRSPAFTLTAVMTLALGVGINAVAFSVVNGLLFKGTMARGLPGIGRIVTTPGGDEDGYASLAERARFVDATRGSLDVAAEGRSSVAWRQDGTTRTAWVLFVSENYFAMVQPPLVAGHLRVRRGEGGPPSVVIGERFWRDALHAPALAGLTLQLNQRHVNVSGIVRESFTGPAGIYSPDVWLPLDDLSLFSAAASLQQRDTRWLFLLGRLLPGASTAQVREQLAVAAADMTRDWPDTHRERGATFWMLDQGNSELRDLRTAAAVGMGVIGLVLVLACFNVTTLLLARAVEGERELGIHTALGARPGRLVRMVVAEGLVLAALAGVVAWFVARWTQSLVGSFAMPIEMPQYVDVAPDSTVGAFVALLILVSGVVPGIWPALSATRVDVLRVLGSQGANSVAARPSRLRAWLVGAQVAGSTVFLAIAALLWQSHAALSLADPGFDRDHLVTIEADPAAQGYDAARAEAYLRLVQERVRALPGVRSVAAADRVPFFIGFDRITLVSPSARACEGDECRAYPTYAVGPGYFATMGIAVTEGRAFDSSSAADSVIVNEAFARTQWPDGGAVGRRLQVGQSGHTVTVVGVAARSQTRGLYRDDPVLYVPLSPDDHARPLTLVARTDGAPVALVRPLRDAALAVDPDVTPTVKTMAQRAEVPLWPFRTLSRMFTLCGVLALLLTTVGLASVVTHAVARRTREFGVRMSIGATRNDLIATVLRDVVRRLAPGLVVGLVLAAGLARLGQAALVGVNGLHPATYLAVALLESAIVLVACIAPALKAARVDPLVALRSP
jgi:predicted permease